MDFVGPLLVQLAVQTPLFLVWVVGMVFALTRLRDPVTARLVLFALIVFLLSGIGGTITSTVLPFSLERAGYSVARLATVFSVVGLIQVAVQIVGWVLILLALFWQPRRVTDGAAVAPTDRSV